MQEQIIIDQLSHLIANELDVNIQFADIDPDAPLLEGGLKLDSLALVELVTLCEGHFAIKFGEEDLTMDTFGSLRALAHVVVALRKSDAA